MIQMIVDLHKDSKFAVKCYVFYVQITVAQSKMSSQLVSIGDVERNVEKYC